jgi:hypothetical protein
MSVKALKAECAIVEPLELGARAPKKSVAKFAQPEAPSPPIPAEVKVDAKSLKTKSELLKILASIVQLREKGRRVALVFDIDNTLMDTRHRTLGAATSFQYAGKNPLAHATVDTVHYRPEDTCKKLGLEDPEAVAAFCQHFGSYFWTGPNLALDRPIDGVVTFAKLARELGAELYFVTGRTTDFRKETTAQLEAAGIAPESFAHLIMKSPVRDEAGRLEQTEVFKARELKKIARDKVAIAGFVTEGARDMCYLQKHAPDVKRFLFLEFPIDEPGYSVASQRTTFLPLELSLPSREEILARCEAKKR